MERRYSQRAKDDCDVCGEEFQVTRTMDKVVPDGEKIVCNDCEMYKRGYDDAVENSVLSKNDKLLLTGLLASTIAGIDEDDLGYSQLKDILKKLR